MSTTQRAQRSDKGGKHAKRVDSRMGRMRLFFETNPDEELTYEQMTIKFDCTLAQARFTVKELVKAQLVESVHVIRNPAKGVAS